ncbi:hypothetical protein QE152_g6116 [Popillia japonica]|uniref:Uncharacterized protein n=1 Tax=Popillia japonica TaxID=7064 RepID=A0AAW1MJW7_POPJA
MGKRKQRVESSDYSSSLEDDNFSLALSGSSIELFVPGLNPPPLPSPPIVLPPEESSDEALQQQNLNDIVQQIKSGNYVGVVYDDQEYPGKVMMIEHDCM